MPGFVIDASATLPWCFADESTLWTEALLDRLQSGEEVFVPAHWPTEVMNGLAMAARRNRIGLDRVARFVSDLSSLAIRIEPPHAPAAWSAVIGVAPSTASPFTMPLTSNWRSGPACPSPRSTAIYRRRRGPRA